MSMSLGTGCLILIAIFGSPPSIASLQNEMETLKIFISSVSLGYQTAVKIGSKYSRTFVKDRTQNFTNQQWLSRDSLLGLPTH
jgi:hypothetical protein